MGMRGINATPKRASRRGRPSAVLLHPWDAPGLSRAERVIRFVKRCLARGPVGRHNLKLRPWQTKFIKRRVSLRQGGQSRGANGGAECGEKEREDPAGSRPMPVRLIWP